MLSYERAKGVQQVAAVVAPDIASDRITDQTVSETSNNTPCAQYARPHYQVGKRIFDIVAASIVLVLLFPVFLAVSIAIFLSGGFPIIYRQVRVGRNGKHFKIYKFRTMIKNAEAVLKDRPELMEEYRRTYKIVNDPRV